MLDADPREGAERLGDLEGRPADAVGLLADGLSGHLDGEAAREPDARRISPGLDRQAPDVLEPGRQRRGGDADEVGEPRVPVARGPPLGGRPFPAHPDRHPRLLERLGREADLGEAVVTPVPPRPLFPPDPVDQLELLVRHRPALFEGGGERVELLDHPADADAEDQAPSRQVVDGRGDLRPVERVAIRKHEDAHSQGDPLRAAGQVGQAGQRLEERRVRGHEEPPILVVRVGGVDPPGRDDPVGRPHRVEPERLETAGGVHQHAAGGPTGDRKEDAELHGGTRAAVSRDGPGPRGPRWRPNHSRMIRKRSSR